MFDSLFEGLIHSNARSLIPRFCIVSTWPWIWANEMLIVMNHVLHAGWCGRSLTYSPSRFPLCYGCPLVYNTTHRYFSFSSPSVESWIRVASWSVRRKTHVCVMEFETGYIMSHIMAIFTGTFYRRPLHILHCMYADNISDMKCSLGLDTREIRTWKN